LGPSPYADVLTIPAHVAGWHGQEARIGNIEQDYESVRDAFVG
jgi:hypothetical protein